MSNLRLDEVYLSMFSRRKNFCVAIFLLNNGSGKCDSSKFVFLYSKLAIQIIKARLKPGPGDKSTILNLSELSAFPQTTQTALNNLIEDYNVRIRSCRHEIASNAM